MRSSVKGVIVVRSVLVALYSLLASAQSSTSKIPALRLVRDSSILFWKRWRDGEMVRFVMWLNVILMLAGPCTLDLMHV